MIQPGVSRRDVLRAAGALMMTGGFWSDSSSIAIAQDAGGRPAAGPAGVSVVLPRNRVPVSLIIDDSTCLVNLNKFAVPQFAAAFGSDKPFNQNWRDWPNEIPDSFVRKFGEWSIEQGVKGKYSIVPFPACVGRLDRGLPGWSKAELKDSIELVKKVMLPNWDIHPEMVTHTRIIDLATGHPHENDGLKFMENWDWTTGRSADEIAAYMVHALKILKNVGLPCEGITTPGGFGNRALKQLSQASFQSVRDVYAAEIPHYFRHLYDSGERSVMPRVENAGGLEGDNPRCVVSIIGCTGDWTGGWDNSTPGGADKFITEDLKSGRMVDVIKRGEPAIMLAHWTGMHWNGQELGFKIMQEVVKRLKAAHPDLLWMKLTEISRYWAAKELTRIAQVDDAIVFDAPYACPVFTIKLKVPAGKTPVLQWADKKQPLEEVANEMKLSAANWWRGKDDALVCVNLPRGKSRIVFA